MNMLALLLSFAYIEISSCYAQLSLYNTGQMQPLCFCKIIFPYIQTWFTEQKLVLLKNFPEKWANEFKEIWESL